MQQVLSVQWVSQAATVDVDVAARLTCSMIEHRHCDCYCTSCEALKAASDLRAGSICRNLDLAQIREIEEVQTCPLTCRQLEEVRCAPRVDRWACFQSARRDDPDCPDVLVEVLVHRNAHEAPHSARDKLEVDDHPFGDRLHVGPHVHAVTVTEDRARDGCHDQSEQIRCLQVHPG